MSNEKEGNLNLDFNGSIIVVKSKIDFTGFGGTISNAFIVFPVDNLKVKISDTLTILKQLWGLRDTVTFTEALEEIQKRHDARHSDPIYSNTIVTNNVLNPSPKDEKTY